MAVVELTNLNQLDPTLVAQQQAIQAELLQEANPELELIRGVIFDILVYFGAQMAAVNETNVQLQAQSRSLLDIGNNPLLADPSLVDAVLSNFLLTRQPGALATGEVTIVVSQNSPVVIPNGSIFTAPGMTFTSNAAYLARTVGSTPTQSTDRVLTPLTDGNFAFTIDVTATILGPAGNISQGTKLVPNALPVNFVTAYATSDFVNGLAPELTSTLLGKLQTGIAAKAYSNRTNILAMLLAQPAFANINGVSIVGFGDPEMTRDQHWIFPASGGGRTDIYARTNNLPQTIGLTKTATLIGTAANGGIWQFSLLRDDAPGFYEIASINLPTANPTDSGFLPTSLVRGFDLSIDGADGVTYAPDIVNAQEAAFSRYSTGICVFTDSLTDVTNLPLGSTKNYLVNVRVMPLIDQIQDFLGGRGVRNPAGDILVKGCVPAFLSLSFQIFQPLGGPTVPVGQIAADLASEVNGLGFPGQIFASQLAQLVQVRLVGQQAVGRIEMAMRILAPSGRQIVLRDFAQLVVPEFLTDGVSGRVVGFCLDAVDVGISVVPGGFAEI